MVFFTRLLSIALLLDTTIMFVAATKIDNFVHPIDWSLRRRSLSLNRFQVADDVLDPRIDEIEGA